MKKYLYTVECRDKKYDNICYYHIFRTERKAKNYIQLKGDKLSEHFYYTISKTALYGTEIYDYL